MIIAIIIIPVWRDRPELDPAYGPEGGEEEAGDDDGGRVARDQESPPEHHAIRGRGTDHNWQELQGFISVQQPSLCSRILAVGKPMFRLDYRWGKGQKHISCDFSILFLKAFMSYRTWLVDENKLLSKNLTICCNPLGAEPPKLRCGGFPDVEASDCARAQQIGIPPTI